MSAGIYAEARKELIDWVRTQLIGPPAKRQSGPDLQNVLPAERFPCGMLYPIVAEPIIQRR